MMLWLALAWADPFAACEQEAETASPRQRHRCVYMAARKTGDFDRAEARLSEATVHRPWALLALGHVRSAVGDPRAEATYLEAVDALSEEPEGLVHSWLGLRFLWFYEGRHDEARRAIERARAAAEGHPDLLAIVEVQDARTRWLQGDARGAVGIASKVDLTGAEHQLKVLTYHVLAGATLELGQVATSWSYSQRLIALSEEAGDRYVEATARLNALSMLEDHPELSHVDRARFAEETLAVAEAGGNPFAVTGARCAVGAIRRDRSVVERCLEEARELDDPASTSIALRHLADLESDPERALELLEDAERAATSTALRFNIAQVQHAKAAVLWSVDRAASEAEAERAVHTIEGIVDTQGDELSRAGFASIWRTAWLAPARRWVEADDAPRAFRWVERMRARELRTQRLGVEVDEAAKERITELQDRLWDDLDDDARAETLAALAREEADARVDLPTVSLDAAQAQLESDQALVVYVLADEPDIDSWVWVIEAEGIHRLPMVEPQEVAPRVERLLGLERVPDVAVAGLREALLDPVLDLTDARRLVVVPDGPLHRLPFGLLIQDRSVSMAPSVTVWTALHADAPVVGVVSVADPEGQQLPYAREEGARWVERLGGELWVGAEATSTQLAEALERQDVVHLATHAEVDEHGTSHELALADGPLRADAVARLELDGAVVVLAACRGADGPVYTSEGSMSLARSFLQGGARTVLTSVVPLRDDQASTLFAAVADAWADGATLAEAVAQVQRTQRAVAPGELGWAGLMVLGDGDVRVEGARAAGWSRASLALGAGGAAGSLFLALFSVGRRVRWRG